RRQSEYCRRQAVRRTAHRRRHGHRAARDAHRSVACRTVRDRPPRGVHEHHQPAPRAVGSSPARDGGSTRPWRGTSAPASPLAGEQHHDGGRRQRRWTRRRRDRWETRAYVLLPDVDWTTGLIDSRVLAYATLMTMFTGIVIGVLPALKAGRVDVS